MDKGDVNMPINIPTVIEELKKNATEDQRKALSILESRFYECITLRKQLEIATKALKDAVKDYNINGPCYEDCVGYYMFHIARKALKEMEGVE